MKKTRKKVLKIIGAIVAVFVVLVAVGYFYGSKHYIVNERTLYFYDLPEEFDGYRILQFSDFHAFAFHCGHEDEVGKIVNLINSQKCDLIVFTGDLVTFRANELDGFEDTLSTLSAPDGVMSIMGNHDYALYMRDYTAEQRKADVEDLHKRQHDMGWTLLLNDHHVIQRGNDSIVIVGIENDGKPPFPEYGDLHKATQNVDSSAFKILLSHDPTSWDRKVLPESNIPLTLSGHTHAGQFKVFGWSPVALIYDQWSGVYDNYKSQPNGDVVKQTLYVNEGVGCVPIPFRIGAWPELTVFTLKKLSD